MIHLGLEPFHGVGIIGFNSVPWFIADLGAIFAHGFAAGIYTTNNDDACEYVVNNCDAQLVFVEDAKQLKKFIPGFKAGRIPSVKAFIQWTGTPEKIDGVNVYSWEEFMAFADYCPEIKIKERVAEQKPNQCCTLIYTSGTTGNPKGVMLSHDNVTWTAKAIASQCQINSKDQVISYLPLSHVAAQMLDIYAPMTAAFQTWFARPDALKGSLVETLRDVRPTIFLGVPR
eukprot:Colp12_sorted_trinity150504_noHs@11823